MKWQCYSLAGTSFHFGQLGGNQEEISVGFSSDSLFAALVHTAAQSMEPSAFESLIESFRDGDPGFLLTSAFPRAGDVRFYPMPLLRDRIDFEALGITLKDIKKTAYLSEGLFLRLLAGEPVSVVYDPSVSFPLQGKTVWVSKAEYENLPEIVKEKGRIWTLEKRPRVTLDRESSASSLFFTGHVDFATECGLWFGLSERKPAAFDIDGLLGKLADQGFGGVRSAGFGAAKLTKSDKIELPDADGRRWITLSRYLPAPDEVPGVLEGETAYSLDEIGGWLYSSSVRSERRRTVHMITEGSVLSGTGKSVYGEMTDVQPDYEGTRPVGHPVWRNGFAAAVGLAERKD